MNTKKHGRFTTPPSGTFMRSQQYMTFILPFGKLIKFTKCVKCMKTKVLITCNAFRNIIPQFTNMNTMLADNSCLHMTWNFISVSQARKAWKRKIMTRLTCNTFMKTDDRNAGLASKQLTCPTTQGNDKWHFAEEIIQKHEKPSSCHQSMVYVQLSRLLIL